MAKPDYDKGFVCEHCGGFCKRYTRSFNANMAMALILLYKSGMKEFVKVEDFLIKKGHKRCGDFSYLIHYEFLEKQKGDRKDGSPRNGFYKITDRGIKFVELKLTAPEKFMILNNKLEGFVGDNVNIKQVLKTKFDYNELMGQPFAKKEKSKLTPSNQQPLSL